MKLLTLTSSFPNEETSHAGLFVCELVKNIADYEITPVVLAPHFPHGNLHECQGKIQVHRFRYFFPTRYERLAYGSGLAYNMRKDPLAFAQIIPFSLAQFFSSLYLVANQKIDLVHSHWILPQGLTGALLHRIWRIPHIATIHGSDLNLIKTTRLLKIICRFIVRNSDVITVNSRFMRQQLLSVDPGCDSKIVIIPMGVNPGRFRPPGNTDRKTGDKTGHVILSVGRLIDWKGMNFLIEALPEVLKRYPDTRLYIIGTGPEQENLRKKSTELNITKAVHFLGNVRSEDILNYFYSADVFVLPSINKSGETEGLGVVLLEAMAAGCPVIGSNVGGIPDIIIDGETGFLVPEQNPRVLADRIIQILSDPGISEKFREKGYSRVSELFTWEKIAGRFSELYSQVLTNQTVSSESGDSS